MEILKHLDELEEILITNNAFVLSHLNGGITTEVFKRKIASVYPVEEIPNTVFGLYSWHNGTWIAEKTPILNYHFFDDYFLCSAEDVAHIIGADDFYLFADRKCLPLFASGSGEYLVINNKEEILYCGSWLPEIAPYTQIYDSLQSMLDTVVTCYKKNAYLFDDNNCLQINYELSHEISASLNPNSEYWRID